MTIRRFKTRRSGKVTLAIGLALVSLLAPAVAPLTASAAVTGAGNGVVQAGTLRGGEGASLESAATKAGETGRKVAMSLIGLAFAIAAVVLAFKRDFKEAAGVFVVGILAVLLATPTGLSLLKDTVSSVFGS